jgi:hypothetical protein
MLPGFGDQAKLTRVLLGALLAALLSLSALAPAFADHNNGDNSKNPSQTATGGGGGGEKHAPASTPGNSPK